MLTIDKNRIYINDYNEMKILDSKHIQIMMKNFELDIVGEELQMTYYDQYEIRLTGNIKVIKYGL